MICSKCHHSREDHYGRDGECRHGFDPFAVKPAPKQCICASFVELKEEVVVNE